MPKSDHEDAGCDGLAPWLRPDEQCVALTAGCRLIQPLRGHRYSVDDMLVAQRAGSGAPRPRRALDLGCGIGSVLLTLAWAFPDSELVGVEALAEHAALARRNVLLNGCQARVRVVAGDLRDEALLSSLGGFDLVTGTPPYFDPRTATVCADRQRAHAHFELNGGIEAYARAAARVLNPGGRFVVCAGAEPPGRDRAAIAAAGLHLTARRVVVPRAGKPPFLTLLTAGTAACGPAAEEPPLLMRHADGARTAEHVAIREWSGVPCSAR